MDYSDLSTVDTNALNSQMGMVGIIANVVAIVVVIALVVSMWKIFTKAGRPGWAAIVPIYNLYVLLKIVNKPGWWIILYILPVLYLIPSILVPWELGKAFGKSSAFSIIFLLLIPVGFFVIAFDNSKYLYGATESKTATPENVPPAQPGVANPIPPTAESTPAQPTTTS